MKKQKSTTQRRAGSSEEPSVNENYESIKLGIDWHASELWVVRIVDGAGPEPAQRFTQKGFLKWALKQLGKAKRVYSCYEAGPGGYVLHRELEKMGITNYVVTPRDLDADRKRVRNDKREARELAQNLDRYVRGNDKAMRVVQVPTPEQEQRRQELRQRDQLSGHLHSLASQGRSLLLTQGWRRGNSWWKQAHWEVLCNQLPDWLRQQLEVYRELILAVEAQLAQLSQKIRKAGRSKPRPVGLGELTLEKLNREIGDWNRFSNRKQVASYAGLVGGVDQSGDAGRDLSINKAGNPRLRTALVEAAWRMVRYQPHTPLIQKWKRVLLNPKAHKRARKKAIVAVARQLMVDLWRWSTGRVSSQQLGWVMVHEMGYLSDPCVVSE